jgi:hypothetical protein
MNAPRLKFSIWVVAISALCWCWATVPEWREFALVALVFAPVFLSPQRQFVQPVDRTGIVVTVLWVGVLLVSAALGWTALSNKWFALSEIRPILIVLLWSALVAVGYYAFFRRRAA